MGAKSQLGTEQENHLEFENPRHREVVVKVMNKWMGPGFAERSGEGQAVQMAISNSQHRQSEAEAVEPKGEMFDVSRQALSDRAYAKYGGGNVMNRPKRMETAEEAVPKKMLSNRKYGK